MHVTIGSDDGWTLDIGVKAMSGSVITQCNDANVSLLSKMC